MSTRSSARNLFPPLDNLELTIRRSSRTDPTLLNNFEMAAEGPGDLPVPDLRTMEELCQPSLNGRDGPITPIAIQATNFRLKNDMIQQVQNSCQGHCMPGDDASKHLDKFLHVTQSIKVNGVTDDALRLYLFPHSLTHHATAWFDRLLRNSINTFEQMAKMFLGKYFPPSIVTKLRNEITNFRQRPDESLFEAWERGTFMKRRLEKCYDLIKNMTAHHNDWDTSARRSESSSSITSFFETKITALKAEMAEINKNLMRPSLATLKTYMLQEPIKFMKMNTASYSGSGTLPGNTITNPKEALKGITTRSGTAYQGPTIPTSSYSPIVERETKTSKDTVHPTNNESTEDVQPLIVPTESLILNFEPIFSPIIEPIASPDLNFNISFVDALILMPKFVPYIKSLLTNKDKLCELARTLLNEHCLAVLLKKFPEKLGDPSKFLIPCVFLRTAECLALADLGPSINLMPWSVWDKLSLPDLSPTCMTLELIYRSICHPVGVAKDVFIKVGTFHFPSDFVVVDFNADPRVHLIPERYFIKTRRALIDVFKEVDAFLALKDDPTSPKVDQSYLDSEGDILLLEAFLNDDPSLPPPNQGKYMPEVRKELKICEAKSDKSSIDEPPEVELKDLPPHLEYAFLEGDDKFPVIIAKDLSVEEKTALITNLKSHKRAIAWKLFDIKGIDPEFCTHKILMKEDFKPVVQHQRRINPKIHGVIKQEVLILLDAGLIYPISDSPWIRRKSHSLVHTERLLTAACLLGYAMHRARYREKMLKRCEDTNLCLNWEKSHFMVKEGIVLGHKISKEWIEVDKAKVDVFAKLPHPTTVKVLGQRQEKHFRPIHYASKTMTEAKANYTTMKKEMLAVVDRGTHFCNDQFAKVMLKFGVTHRLATSYHPQTSGQVEVSNRGLKRILERRVGENRASWSDKLDDALWAFRTAYKTPIGCTSYKLVYGKACHLPIELEHKAYWALKHANFDLQTASDHKKVQLNELNEPRDQAYENSLIYKEKTKRLHNSKIKDCVFNIGDRVLLFNSPLKIFSGKLKSRWSGPFTISHVFPYDTVELS
nr:reverse transcriptase domain-containing protein [Tanacetum cinerariifolium]